MAYSKSDNIKVFPASNRVGGSRPLLARAFTEFNVVSIVNRLVDKDSFVITNKDDVLSVVGGNVKSFEFNIHGYYFKLDNLYEFLLKSYEGFDSQELCISAHIKCDSDTTTNFIELKPFLDSGDNTALDVEIDDVDTFNGVYFSIAPKNGDTFTYDGTITSLGEDIKALTHSLDLFTVTKSGDTFKCVIPPQSLIKFVNGIVIDDGVLI